MIAVPRYLYHRTSMDSYMGILMDKKLRHIGTPASNRRFKRLKFDEHGRDKWKCVFLAESKDLTKGLVCGGDVVLKIRTENLDPQKFEYDGNVSLNEYGKSFTYGADIPTSEIVGTYIDKWKHV